GVALAIVYLSMRGAGAWTIAGAIMVLLATVPLDWQLWLRAFNPIDFVQRTLPSWHHPIFALGTLAALILLGIALLQAGFSAWIGIIAIGYSIVLAVIYLVFRDLPPFTFYFLTLGIGIVMVR
ncbi:MAG: hypothetical protein KGJ80_20585, partial [Chloroflexota bacterium]|nr:hypothetical protein [Chloroflexota bacterium]